MLWVIGSNRNEINNLSVIEEFLSEIEISLGDTILLPPYYDNGGISKQAEVPNGNSTRWQKMLSQRLGVNVFSLLKLIIDNKITEVVCVCRPDGSTNYHLFSGILQIGEMHFGLNDETNSWEMLSVINDGYTWVSV